MDIDSLSVFLAKRNRKSDIRENIIGQEIKKRRKERNLTQDEIVDGICCISYLSKMENNLIKPNVQYVSDIMKKMDIDDDFYLTTDIFSRYYRAILKETFYHQNEITEKIMTKIGNKDISYLTDLLRLMSRVNSFGSKNLDFIVERLLILKENMIDDDLALFLLYLMIYYYQNRNYYMAYRIERLLRNSLLDDYFFKGVYWEYRIYIMLKIDDNISVQNFINEYNTLCTNLSNFSGIQRVKLVYYEYLLMKRKPDVYQEIGKNDPLIKESKKLKIDEYIYSEQCYRSINVLNSFIQHDERYWLCFLRVNVCLNNRRQISEALNVIEQNRFFEYDIDVIHFINVVRREYIDKSRYELKTYLRDVVIPYYIEMSDINCLNYYTEKLIEIYIEESQYKSATIAHQKRNRRIMELSLVAWM